MTSKTTITPELLDQLLANYEKPEDLTGDEGLFKQLKKALIERALPSSLLRHGPWYQETSAGTSAALYRCRAPWRRLARGPSAPSGEPSKRRACS
jgi:hypothetical protein